MTATAESSIANPTTFPILTPEQLARAGAGNPVHSFRAGEVLIAPGTVPPGIFVVLEGTVEIRRVQDDSSTLIALLEPGQFTGEVGTLAGRPTLPRIAARTDGKAYLIERDRLLKLVQTDSELGDILMRVFILRRVELVNRGLGDVVLVGSDHCGGTQRIREFLTRNNYPFSEIDLDRETDVERLLNHLQIRLEDVPVLICRGTTSMRNPSNQVIADCLGFNAAIEVTRARDVIVVGAGPAGLGTAVYAASEGLDVLVLETIAPGGQAGSSSKIENYLGFPTGVSGQSLAIRAHAQAQKFGAQMMIARTATRLGCGRKPYTVEVDHGETIEGRAIVIAAGAEYRKLSVSGIERFEGAGVYYSATAMERRVCGNEEVVVVGGGNSAGQAAVFLAETSPRVHLLVRADGLADSMSRYLINRIEQHPRIQLVTRSEIVAIQGNGHLEAVTWRSSETGKDTTLPLRHVFVMAGAVPNTKWLEGCVALDDKGFVKTGTDLSPEDLAAASWPPGRPPYLLETSRPGVFAVGDVRSGNLKRVASAVGEGSIAVSLVHRVLREGSGR
ncbi:MAG TPA: FAD-dependent oxidoreductase [Candidatus Eisenbacteria bacterium]|nr:FAD-dependent oxidoreductase [Candidatus Eisenbacteria bacterium]